MEQLQLKAKSISSGRTRKRDKFLRIFRSSEPEARVCNLPAPSSAKTQSTQSAYMSVGDDVNPTALTTNVGSAGRIGAVRLWGALTVTSTAILTSHTNNSRSLEYSLDDEQIITSSWDKTIRLWSAQTGAAAVLEGHSELITGAVLSPGGQLIASAGSDHTVHLWDARTGKPDIILIGHTGSVDCVAFSPSGQQMLSGSYDRTVHLWDVKSGKYLAVVKGFHDKVDLVAWDAGFGGSSFVTASGQDKAIRMWRAVEESGRCSARLQWTTRQDQLTFSDTIIQNVQGLSRVNTKLLEQRGAQSSL